MKLKKKIPRKKALFLWLVPKQKESDREPGDEQTTTCACDDHDLPRVASP